MTRAVVSASRGASDKKSSAKTVKKLHVKKSSGGGGASKAGDFGDKRQLRRRTSQETATRAVNLKLSSYARSQVECNTNKDAMNAEALVLAEVRRVRQEKTYIKGEFWTNLIADLKLGGSLSDGLPLPAQQEVVAKALDQSLRLAHSPNPASRSAGRLVKYLNFVETLNETEYFGVLRGSVESHYLSKSLSAQIMEAVLRFSARSRADLKFPQHWSVMRTAFDRLLLGLWERSQARSMTRSQFIRAWRAELSLFMDMPQATSVVTASDEKREPDVGVLEEVASSSLVGAELFSPETMLADLLHFKSEIRRLLQQLEDVNFDASEMEGYKQICTRHAENLDDGLWDKLDCRSQELPYLTCPGLQSLAVVPHDLFYNCQQARIRSLAVSNSDVPRLPHEKWLYNELPLAGMPTTIVIPEHLIYDMSNCREYLLKKLESFVPLTSESLKRCMRTNSAECLRLDPLYWLDEAFVEQAYEGLIDTHLKNCVLNILPSAGQRRSLAKAVAAGELLCGGVVATAQKLSLQKELRAPINLLSEIDQGRGPTSAEAGKMSLWCSCVLKKAENFTVFEDEVVEQGVTRTKTFVGAEALQRRYDRAAAVAGVKEASDLKEFRAFAWMLSAAQAKSVNEWQREAVATSGQRLKLEKAKMLKDVEEKTKSKNSTTAQAPTAITAPPLKKSKASGGVQDLVISLQPESESKDDEEEGEGCVLSFFGAKAV